MNSPHSGFRRFETSRAAWCLFFALAVLLTLVEASYPLKDDSTLRAAAGWTWLVCSALVLEWVFISILMPFCQADFWRAPDLLWFLAAAIVPIGLVFFEVNGWRFTQINDEAPQQVAYGFIFFTQFRDFGIFKFGFLGYPARQYLLAAAPSYLWGRSLAAMRLGYGGLYALGYLSFLQGTRRYLAARGLPRPMLHAGLAGILVSMGAYPLLYARLFEQTIVPFSLTCLFLGGLLLFLSRPGPLSALWVAWTLGLLPYSYTPSYAVWGLAMVLLVWMLFVRSVGRRTAIIACLVCGAATFATSVAGMAHEKMLAGKLTMGDFDHHLTPMDWIFRMSSGFHAAFGLEESLVPAPLVIGLVLVLYHSLRRRDYRVAYVCVWAAASLVMALGLKGYCWREADFDIQRAMFILPVLGLAVVLYMAKNWAALTARAGERGPRGILIAVMLVMLVSSGYLPFMRRSPRAFEPSSAADLEEATMLVVDHAGESPRTIFLLPPFDCQLEDALAYFWPDTKVVRAVPPDGEHAKGNYVITFLRDDPVSRLEDRIIWHLHRRPYLKIYPE